MKNVLEWHVVFESTKYCKHCLKYWVKSAFFPAIGKLFIFVLYHLSATLLSSFISPKRFFPAQWTLFKIYTGESLTKHLEFGLRCFPPLNFGFNGSWFEFDQLRSCFLVGRQSAVNGCWHTAAVSGWVLRAFPRCVAGHFVHLSTNYLLSCPPFIFLLFYKHSSNELNGRLTNQ